MTEVLIWSLVAAAETAVGAGAVLLIKPTSSAWLDLGGMIKMTTRDSVDS